MIRREVCRRCKKTAFCEGGVCDNCEPIPVLKPIPEPEPAIFDPAGFEGTKWEQKDED